MTTDTLIPVLRPQLPDADRLLPYLRRIDDTRVYSNWGPLALELEERLARHFALPPGAVVSAGSGTSALVGAILASAGRAGEERRLAIVPAFTFVATAAAAECCGYDVVLADVDSETWMLDADQVASRSDLNRVGVVVPVAPFGRPVPQQPWLRFRDATGIPVAIDGAASFELATAAADGALGPLPMALSFHATKSFATGEGGGVAATDVDLVERAGQSLNLGMSGSRDSATPSVNGKLSEYHAAVGLAELDGWEWKREAMESVIGLYRETFDRLGVGDRLVLAPDIASVYVLFQADSEHEAREVAASLTRAEVSYRFWYGAGLQAQTVYASRPHEPLPATETLAVRLLGLPFAVDLTAAEVERIAGAVLQGLETR